ncbi:hypothetical protein ABZ297_00850 [Nonomuraea sp. NPDC005983]|uniref:hypothetical protein n=1 Tax=Nonomuraea sp. NPDC005983 TaxID=3155595 RepID=UPI00339F46A6
MGLADQLTSATGGAGSRVAAAGLRDDWFAMAVAGAVADQVAPAVRAATARMLRKFRETTSRPPDRFWW